MPPATPERLPWVPRWLLGALLVWSVLVWGAVARGVLVWVWPSPPSPVAADGACPAGMLVNWSARTHLVTCDPGPPDEAAREDRHGP